ncbi:hypothetical protein HGRIS_003804 [Hohenbuehelia grisea]|uniref:Uncharacterized protein n=1 Tax=Hohenbuehelia grisea TaxID=104357 RepID=A0ABR3JHK4_9AGAR
MRTIPADAWDSDGVVALFTKETNFCFQFPFTARYKGFYHGYLKEYTRFKVHGMNQSFVVVPASYYGLDLEHDIVSPPLSPYPVAALPAYIRGLLPLAVRLDEFYLSAVCQLEYGADIDPEWCENISNATMRIIYYRSVHARERGCGWALTQNISGTSPRTSTTRKNAKLLSPFRDVMVF